MENPIEKSALRISVIGATVFALVGLTFAVITRSQAILLDGAFNLISAVLALFASRIATLVGRPDTIDRPLGYIALEPFYVLIKGLILSVLTIVVVIGNVIVLFQGGSELKLGVVVVYVSAVVLGNAIVYLLIRKKEKISTSPLITIECENWSINTLISSAIAISFILVFFLKETALSFVVPYVDQVVVIVVGLVSLPVPIRAIKKGLGELLLLGPDKDLYQMVCNIVEAGLKDFSVKVHKVYVLQIGRKLLVTVYVEPESTSVSSNYSDRIKSSLKSELLSINSHTQLDVIVSTDL